MRTHSGRATLAGIAIAFAVAASGMPPALAADAEALPGEYAEHCKQPEMPSASQQLAESGVVRVAVRLAPDGTIADAHIAHSSGFTRLDDAVLESVRACRFAPRLAAGTALPDEGEIRVRFAFDVRSWFPLQGVAEIEHLKKLVSIMSKRCAARVSDLAGQIETADAAWHARNDAIGALIGDYRALYYADIRQYAANEDPEGAIQALDRTMEARIGPAASQAYAGIEDLSAPRQRAYCQRYTERLAAGEFDLTRAIITFPELESFIRKRSPMALSP